MNNYLHYLCNKYRKQEPEYEFRVNGDKIQIEINGEWRDVV